MIINVVVDLSHWDRVEFKLAKEDGIEGVIHKATEGLTDVDSRFAERRTAAEKEGLLFGAYHFGIGKDGNGRGQAEHFLKTVGSSSNVLLALNIEENNHGGQMTPKQAEDFVNKVHEATGRFPMIHGTAERLEDFDTPILKKCPLWIVCHVVYIDEPILPRGWKTWTLWQYTDGLRGNMPQSVEGIGTCDRNRFNGTLQELKDFWTSKSEIEIETITNVVVDLSHWDAKVDFKLAKENGIEGVIHKATQGLTYLDPTYADRRTAAEKEGLLFGAYHFGTGDNGEDQAVHFLEKVGNTSKVLLVLDIEENNSGPNMRPKQAEDFVKKVHAATGRFPMIYGSANFLQDFDTPTLKKCPLWIARYGANPILPKGREKWTLWQYTDGQSGGEPKSVKGIGSCDRNKFNGTLQELKGFWTSKSEIEIETITNVVVDLSHWDAKVDFKLAKENGIEGVIHKATQGLTYLDPTYAERRTAAEKEGLLFGAYHFGTGDNGEDQAVHFLEKVCNTFKVLLVLDIEENNSGPNMRPKQAEDFVKKVHAATGRFPMIYGSANLLQDFDTPTLKKCPLWIARYGANPILPKGREKWTLWQYTDGQSGGEPKSVKGIGSCDRNKFNGTLQKLKDFWISG